MLAVFIAVLVLQSNAVNWQGNWAYSCDFRGGDLSSVQIAGNKCGPTCQSTSGCTHFTWTTFKAGTCWMKSGKVSKTDAYDINDGSVICGLLDTVPVPAPNPVTTPGSSSSGNSVVLGVNYDAMHNKEYPLGGGSAAGLPSAMDQDFQQISRYFKYARTFYSSYYGFPFAQYAAKYGVKLYLGVFMTDESWYKNQVDSAVEAVKNYPGTVEAIFVGNENLRPNGPYSADQIIARINGIKQAVKSATGRDVPVGTVQRISEWVNDGIKGETAKLAAASDIIGVNIYPFFGNYDPNRPTDSLNAQWNLMISRYGSSKVRLTETGHPTAGGNSPSGVVASLDASVKYFNAVKNWKPSQSNGPMFWFAMYDRQPADNTLGNGVEKNFGIFKYDRSQKSSQFP